MLLKFSRKNVGPMEDKELVFAPHVNVFTGDNSLGKSFLLDLLWFGLTRVWPADLNRRLSQGLPARPRDITAKSASLEYEFRRAGNKSTNVATFSYDKERVLWRAKQGKQHKAGLVIYAMADGGYAVWDPIQNYHSDECDKKEYSAFVLSPSELWPAPPKRDGSTEIVEKSSFCNGVLKDWAKWQGATKEQHLFELLKTAMMGLTPSGDIVGFPDLADAETASGDDQPVIELKYGKVLLKHASSSIRRMAALAYVLVWAISQHAKAAKNRGLPIASQIIVLADEIETHLHPRWQRSVMNGLIKTVNALCAEEKFKHPDVQLFVSTHSPLVMAALEDVFCAETSELPPYSDFAPKNNKWFNFDLLETGKVDIAERPFEAQGTAESWLKSKAFNLKSTYSPDVAEKIDEIKQILEQGPAKLSAEVKQRAWPVYQFLAQRLPHGNSLVFRLQDLLENDSDEGEVSNS